MENEYNSLYPPKPFLEKEEQRQGHIAVTIFSIVLFAMTFLLFFGQQIVFLVELMAVLIVHEMGHFLMMKRFGYKNVRMLFVPLMGAFVHGSKDEYKQKESILVILAGPLPGIALAVAFWFLGHQFQILWMVEVALWSFLINAINLLPILPMDGGRLLNVMFFQRIELFQVIFAFCSSIAMIAFGFFFDYYLFMIFGFLMGFQVRSRHRRYLVHKSLRDSQVEYTTTYEKLTDQAYHFIKKEVLEHTPGLRKFTENSEEMDTSVIVAGEVNNMLEPPLEKDAGWAYVSFIVFIWIAAVLGSVFFVLQSNGVEFNGL
jgi:stage IV sporulation protein FB